LADASPCPGRPCFSADSDVEFIACSFCAQWSEKWQPFAPAGSICTTTPAAHKCIQPSTAQIAETLLTYGEVNAGMYWSNNTAAMMSMQHLVQHMPRRDAMALFNAEGSDAFLMFIFEHMRYALLSRGSGYARSIPDDIFLDYVLPYSFLNEKRDVEFRWRPRFEQVFSDLVSNSSNTTEAMRRIADALPDVAIAGVLELSSMLVPGRTVRWKSETSPMHMSPEQVVLHSGSCTGTAITLAAAARSVGIPARIAGCSQSVQGDDHHWVEFYDDSYDGPFQNHFVWHTKEGTSAGNRGGPWDSPSGPMNGCLKYLVPHNSLNTMWASSWSSSVYMPLQWTVGQNAALHRNMSFVGGVNLCGDYCSAWGCGSNQTDKWSQAECF